MDSQGGPGAGISLYHDFDDDGGGGEGKQLLLWTCRVNWDKSSQMSIGSSVVTLFGFLVFLTRF